MLLTDTGCELQNMDVYIKLSEEGIAIGLKDDRGCHGAFARQEYVLGIVHLDMEVEELRMQLSEAEHHALPTSPTINPEATNDTHQSSEAISVLHLARALTLDSPRCSETSVTAPMAAKSVPLRPTWKGKVPPIDLFSGEMNFEDWLLSLKQSAKWNAWSNEETTAAGWRDGERTFYMSDGDIYGFSGCAKINPKEQHT